MILRATTVALAFAATAQSAVQARMGVKHTPSSILHAKAECVDTACTCDMISQALTGVNSTLEPSDGAYYEDFEDINYSAACRLPAACIVNPKDAQEVSQVMVILSEMGTNFSVRSGGHNYIPGFASIDESGVLISLSQLNSTELSQDKSSIKVGPGNRWEAVYDMLVPEGLMVVGGRVGAVGVGGLLLGGGMSYFSSEYGLAMDNVKSYEVVLGNGTIVTASADNEYSDLYKGLRGGATNFGIVTSYELYTHTMGDMYMEARSYTTNQTTDFFQAVAEYQKKGQLDAKSSISAQILETGPTLLLLYSEPAQQPEAFEAFYALESYSVLLPAINGSLMDVLALAGSRFSTGDIRVYGETFSHEADGDLMIELYEIFMQETANLPTGANWTWVPNPVASSVATIGQQYGGNLLGLEEVAQQWYEWYITWEDSAQDSTIHDISARITERCTQAAQEKNLLLPYLFMNTAGQNQKVLQSFGTENVDYIKAVAAKYDSDQVFQKLQNDGFLIRDL
ncbi:hypothetical protein F4809DRAFT_638572 [Biscogniauxia mediterranea]|nr:hypothetical protein F4809DRAFT_638572 [Biscogniauxia mediterranea]